MIRECIRQVAVLGLAVAMPAMAAAEESSVNTAANVGVFSQYVFRGIAQTDEHPALQGGLDLAHTSGLYAGVWGSNISWISDLGTSSGGNSLELDLYGGYRGTFGDSGLGYDAGLIYYWYSGDTIGGFDPDTTEIYAALTYQWAGFRPPTVSKTTSATRAIPAATAATARSTATFTPTSPSGRAA
jgi:uncharacterized protein (TIGR02001 family)